MYISFQIEGVTQLSRNLQGVDADMKNWYEEFKQTGDYLKNFFTNDVFESRGSVFGESWQELSPAYAQQKAKKYPGAPILELIPATMRYSFDFEATGGYVRVFNTVDYFKYHQSNQSRSKLPRRVMMKLDETRKQKIVQIFHAGVDNSLRKNGFKTKYSTL